MEREIEIPSFLLDEVDTQVIEQTEAIIRRFFKGKTFEREAVAYMANMLEVDDFDDLTILLEAIVYYSPKNLESYEVLQTAVIFIHLGCEEEQLGEYLALLGLPPYHKLRKGMQEFLEPRIHGFVPIAVEIKRELEKVGAIGDEIRKLILEHGGILTRIPSSGFGPN